MDKQVQYVKITSATSSEWYDDRIGELFPVLFESTAFYYVTRGLAIDKQDCEVVPHPSQQPQSIARNTQNLEILAKAHAETYKTRSLEQDHLMQSGFIAGYKAAKSEPDGEGKHLITTEQLQHLMELCQPARKTYFLKDSLKELLTEWFPEVFAPQKQVIAVTDKRGTEYYQCEVMGILRTTKNKSEAYVIESQAHGSELMNYLQESYDECRYSFDVLEDTPQQEYDQHDNVLPRKLK